MTKFIQLSKVKTPGVILGPYPLSYLTNRIPHQVLLSPNRIYTRYRSKILFSPFIHYLKTWMFFPKIMQEFLFLFCLLVTHSPKNSRSDLLETEFRSCQYPAVNSQMISNHPSPRRPLNTPPSHFLHLTYYSSDILNFGSWNWPGPYPSLPSA